MNNSAEVIVDDLRYETKGKPVVVERNDCPGYSTPEVIIEGLNIISP